MNKCVIRFGLYLASGLVAGSVLAQIPSDTEVKSIFNANRQMTAIGSDAQRVGSIAGTGKQSAGTPRTTKSADLLVFVSASMPPDLLRNYSRQAHDYGAVLVLRGFVKDKLSETRALVAALNEGGAEWMIQPKSFKLFKVDRVPTIVLSLPSNGSVTEDGCAPESNYVKANGDLAIGAALDLFALKASPELSVAAKTIIVDYRAKFAPGKAR